jgi:hypothetical protein
VGEVEEEVEAVSVVDQAALQERPLLRLLDLELLVVRVHISYRIYPHLSLHLLSLSLTLKLLVLQ